MSTDAKVPKHVAIIMDGNGRWAQKRFMPRWMGHRTGADSARSAIEFAARAGVDVLSLFAFGVDNWRRPAKEINGLMDLFYQHLVRETKSLKKHGIRIRFVGDMSAFSEKLQLKIQEAESLTQDGQAMTLVVAANYSGQWDVCQATQKVAALCEQGEHAAADITQDMIASELCLADFPDPDLFIRTSGEQRISNFYLWQLAYTELYFSDVLWPDFKAADFQKALDWYATRERRYGFASATEVTENA